MSSNTFPEIDNRLNCSVNLIELTVFFNILQLLHTALAPFLLAAIEQDIRHKRTYIYLFIYLFII